MITAISQTECTFKCTTDQRIIEVNNEKTVKINLGKDTLPINFEKAKTSRPSSNFVFLPKLFHHLKDYVRTTGWDYVEKKLSISIFETPKMDVLKWMSYVEEQHQLTQRSAFVDYNHIVLTVLDEEGRAVSSIKFHKPEILGHKCFFCKTNIGEVYKSGTHNFLNHQIELSYAAAEIFMPSDNDGPIDEGTGDKEWKTMELPA